MEYAKSGLRAPWNGALDLTKLQEMERAGVQDGNTSGQSGGGPRLSTGGAVITFGILCCALALVIVLAVATAAVM